MSGWGWDPPTTAPSTADDPDDAWGVAEADRYTLRHLLGEGGMGQVYAAYDRRLRREVALKVATRDAEAERRLGQEAWIAAHLDHPGIVPIHDAGALSDGRRFVVMRRVAGRTLRDLVRERPQLDDRLPLVRAVLQACEAVGCAHDAGIVHRDLKPDHVIVGAHGEVQVVDWGLARPIPGDDAARWARRVIPEQDAARTRIGQVIGTPGYMSPEQAAAAPVDARSDVWALGAILHELLTGDPPHGRLTSEAFARKVSLEDVPPVRQRAPQTPPGLAAIVDRSLRRDPSERHPDAGRLAAELASWLDARALRSARPARWPWVVGLAAAAAVGFLLAPGGDAGAQRDAEGRALRARAAVALTRDARPEAEVLAAHALATAPDPVDRGVLAGLYAQERPAPADVVPLPAHRIVALSDDGAWLVVWTGDELVALEADGTVRWRRVFRAEEPALELMDGLVVARPKDPDLYVFDAEDGALLLEKRGVNPYATSDGGPTRALVAGRGVITVSPGSEGPSVQEHAAPAEIMPLAIALDLPDGTLLVSDRERRLRRHDPDTDAWLPLPDLDLPTGDSASAARLSRDGGTVWIGSHEGDVLAWDPASRTTRARWSTGLVNVKRLVEDPTGTRLAVIDIDGHALLLDSRTGERLARLPRRRWHGVAFRADGALVTVDDAALRVQGLPSGRSFARLDGLLGVSGLDASLDGEAVAIAHVGTWRVVHPDGTSIARVPPHTDTVKDVALSPDGRSLAASRVDRRGMDVWRLPHADSERLVGGRPVRRLAWLRGGLVLGAPWQGPGPVALDSATWEPVAELSVPGAAILDIEPTAQRDGAALVTDTHELYRLDADTRRLLPLDSPLPEGMAVAAGARTWVADRDEVVGLSPDAPPLRFSAGPGIEEIQISPDDRWLVVGRRDGEVHVHDARTGTLVARILGHDERVVTATFTPSGHLLTGSWDGTVRRWDLSVLDAEPATLVAAAERTWGVDLATARAALP